MWVKFCPYTHGQITCIRLLQRDSGEKANPLTSNHVQWGTGCLQQIYEHTLFVSTFAPLRMALCNVQAAIQAN